MRKTPRIFYWQAAFSFFDIFGGHLIGVSIGYYFLNLQAPYTVWSTVLAFLVWLIFNILSWFQFTRAPRPPKEE